MATPALAALWALALGILALGAGLAFRAGTAIRVQERLAERISWAPPSDHPDYYDDTREHRLWTFRFGGTVLLVVGACLLAVAAYATLFLESFPA